MEILKIKSIRNLYIVTCIILTGCSQINNPEQVQFMVSNRETNDVGYGVCLNSWQDRGWIDIQLDSSDLSELLDRRVRVYFKNFNYESVQWLNTSNCDFYIDATIDKNDYENYYLVRETITSKNGTQVHCDSAYNANRICIRPDSVFSKLSDLVYWQVVFFIGNDSFWIPYRPCVFENRRVL